MNNTIILLSKEILHLKCQDHCYLERYFLEIRKIYLDFGGKKNNRREHKIEAREIYGEKIKFNEGRKLQKCLSKKQQSWYSLKESMSCSIVRKRGIASYTLFVSCGREPSMPYQRL